MEGTARTEPSATTLSPLPVARGGVGGEELLCYAQSTWSASLASNGAVGGTMSEASMADAVQAAADGVTLGLEIANGATRLTAGRRRGAEIRRWLTRLPAPPPAEDGLAAINALIERALSEGGPRPGGAPRIGVAVWGTVDAERGTIHMLPQAPGWEGFPLAARLAERWGQAVRVESATNAAVLAEAELGAGRGSSPLLYVLLARGVTAAFIVKGAVVHGTRGAEGMVGHWLVRPDGPRCSCGLQGHLDPLASAQSLVRNMIGRASDSDESTAAMLRVTGGRAEAMTAAQVARLAAEGDPAARAVLDDALDGLATALANLVAMLDPAAIVIGGPLVEAGDDFFAPLRQRLDALCSAFTQVPPVVPGALEPHAALAGALLLAEGRGVAASPV
jgi:glucokinase